MRAVGAGGEEAKTLVHVICASKELNLHLSSLAIGLQISSHE